jgi:fatty-acid desaturase
MFQLKYYWLIMLVYFGVWSMLFSVASWFIVTGHTFLALVTVNIIGHRNNTPTNIPIVGLFFAGETYHKTHHTEPNNPRFGLFDPGWWFIRLVQCRKER